MEKLLKWCEIGNIFLIQLKGASFLKLFDQTKIIFLVVLIVNQLAAFDMLKSGLILSVNT